MILYHKPKSYPNLTLAYTPEALNTLANLGVTILHIRMERPDGSSGECWKTVAISDLLQ